jgi:hypothetical protein
MAVPQASNGGGYRRKEHPRDTRACRSADADQDIIIIVQREATYQKITGKNTVMDDKPAGLIIPASNPLKLTGPWGFLPSSDDVRTLTTDAVTKPDDSRGPDMPACPLVIDHANGRRTLSPVFVGGPFIVIRNDPAGPPRDFVSACGRVAGNDPPALHCFEDHQTRSSAAKRHFVLVAFSDLDLAALRLLGFPVTSASGLARLTAAESKDLLTMIGKPATGQPQPGSNPLGEKKSFKLILVGAEVFKLKNQMPVGLLNVVNQFRRIERSMEIKMDAHIGVWLPPAAEFRAVTDSVALADSALVRSKFVASLMRSTMSIAGYLKSTAGPPVNDLFAARQKLSDSFTDLPKATFGTRDVRTRLDDLFRAFDIAFVERIRRDSIAANSSLDRALLNVAAELMEMQFDLSELAQRAAAAIETGNPANTLLPLENRLELNLKIADGLIKIHREIGKT